MPRMRKPFAGFSPKALTFLRQLEKNNSRDWFQPRKSQFETLLRDPTITDILVNGLFLIPVLAATQLRPLVCAAVAGPTTVVYFLASVATKSANGEPWSSVLLRTWAMAGLAASNGEARRLIQQAGVSVNDQVARDAAQSIGEADLNAEGAIKLSKGKKKHALIKAS